MTTSHRPQLEARSGAKSADYVPTGTQHARLLPGHTSLKRRMKKEFPNVDEDAKLQAEADITKEREEVEETKHSYNEEATNDKSLCSSDNDDEYSDEEDPEILRQELERIRASRANQKTSTQIEDLKRVEKSAKVEKTWRNTTTFGRKKQVTSQENDSKTHKKQEECLNNITKSNYHQQFMNKFIK